MNLNNAIVAELDIEVPPLDFAAVEQFCDSTRKAYRESKHSIVDAAHAQRNFRQFPWERRVLERDNEIMHDVWSVDAFADVKKIIDQLEVDEAGRSVVMIFQDGQPGYDLNFHFDNIGVLGFRICFGLSDEPFLEFSRIKDEFRQHTLNLGNGKLLTDMLEPRVLSFTPSKPNCVLVVNGDSYPHRVHVSTEQSTKKRAVFVVYGKAKRLDFPVVQSLEKSL